MNIRQVSILVAVAIISVFATHAFISRGFFSSSDPTEPKDKKEVIVKYKVSEDASKLEVVSNDSGTCITDTKKGCVKIKKSDTGLITYTFENDDNAWVLRQFTICRGETPITIKCGAELTLDEQLEFFVMSSSTGGTILLTPKSGEVKLTQLSGIEPLRTFYLFDQNTIKQNYYYNIQACNTETEVCLTLDPPVENRGRN